MLIPQIFFNQNRASEAEGHVAGILGVLVTGNGIVGNDCKKFSPDLEAQLPSSSNECRAKIPLIRLIPVTLPPKVQFRNGSP